jgi:hypothetical protein
MSDDTNLQITIEFLPVGAEEWRVKHLQPSEYFDLEPWESVDLDCCPHYNHAIDYLDLAADQIQATHLRLVSPKTQEQRLIVEKFWNQGKNRIIERTDLGDRPYSETILEIQVSQVPPIWEILRLSREQDSLTPLYHAFLQDNADGSQTETIVADMPRPLTLQP